MTFPLVSVITSTWMRPGPLLERAIPSVRRQTYPNVEHVVVSDGPDPQLRAQLQAVRFEELPTHDDTVLWGYRARMHGIAVAQGEVVAYLDDDDAWREDHLDRTVGALLAQDADFAYAKMAIHHPTVPAGLLPWLGSVCGQDPPQRGHIGTSAIVHRRELLDKATWRPHHTSEPLPPLDDWELVSGWLDAGATYAFVDEFTADYYPNGH